MRLMLQIFLSMVVAATFVLSLVWIWSLPGAPHKATITDPTPQSVLDLEKQLGVSIVYEHGREAFIKYGYEHSLYSAKSFGFAWGYSLDEVIEQAKQEFLRRQRASQSEKYKSAARRWLEQSRALEWDARHPTEKAQ